MWSPVTQRPARSQNEGAAQVDGLSGRDSGELRCFALTLASALQSMLPSTELRALSTYVIPANKLEVNFLAKIRTPILANNKITTMSMKP